MTPKKKRAIRNELPRSERPATTRQRFRSEWLSEDVFKNWLAAVPGEAFKARCKCCKTDLIAGHSELVKHAQTQGHKDKFKSLQNQRQLPILVGNENKKNRLDDDVKVAEIRLCAFLTDHIGVPISCSDHLGELLKDVFKDSQIAQKLSLHRTKATSIITNVLGKYEDESLTAILKVTEFAIFVDEATDVSSTKLMAVVVRYWSDSKKNLITRLFEVISLDALHCKAEELANTIIQSFKSKGIPITNIIAMASDNASVMIGSKNSLMTNLMKEANECFISIKCICHSLAIAASKAAMMLPRYLEDLIKDISSYFGHSSKRQAELAELQQYLQTEQQKIIKPSQTRWLVLQHCVDRILNQWHVLERLFLLARTEDRLIVAETISQNLNIVSKAYLEFMKYILDQFNSINALFQSEKPLIGVLQKESIKFIKKICQNFMKPSTFNDMNNIHQNDPHLLLPIEKLLLGEECNKILESFPDSEKHIVQDIRLRCLSFYQIAVSEIKKRLPLTDPMFEEFAFVEPKIALKEDTEGRPSLKILKKQYGALLPDVKQLEHEWRTLPYHFTNEEKEIIEKKDPVQFWSELSEIQDYSGKMSFLNVSKLAKLVLTLPHSNADTERIFSLLTDTKTKKRNKLGAKTLNAVAIVKSAMMSNKQDCRSYPITKDCIKLHSLGMYDFKLNKITAQKENSPKK